MSAAAEAVFGDDNLRAFIVQCRTEAMQAMRIQKVRLSMLREIRELFTPAFVSRWCSEDFMDAWPEIDVWGGLRLYREELVSTHWESFRHHLTISPYLVLSALHIRRYFKRWLDWRSEEANAMS